VDESLFLFQRHCDLLRLPEQERCLGGGLTQVLEQGGGILLKGASYQDGLSQFVLKVDGIKLHDAVPPVSRFVLYYSTRQGSAQGSSRWQAKTDHAAMILLRVG